MPNRIAILEGYNTELSGFAGVKKGRKRKSGKKSRKSTSRARRSTRKASKKASKYTRSQVRSAFKVAAVKCRVEAPQKGKYGTCMRNEIKRMLKSK